jgi:hypothetical protein
MNLSNSNQMIRYLITYSSLEEKTTDIVSNDNNSIDNTENIKINIDEIQNSKGKHTKEDQKYYKNQDITSKIMWLKII